MKQVIAALVLLVLAISTVCGTALAADGAQFNLGFKALADQIPEVVGLPVENEHYGANGDSLEQTTTGLMVWRKADNWTAFTDGSKTWINGPSGVQSRDNNDRFDWERQAASDSSEASEITLWDRRSMPIAYIATNDENTIYLWTGEPAAYLVDDHVYGFNGQHLGWFQDNVVWDWEAVALGFTKDAPYVAHPAGPAKAPKQPKPAKLPREAVPPQPPKTLGVYTELLSTFLRMGMIK